MKRVWSFVRAIPGDLMILAVRGYQIFIGPWLPRMCRFEPSCSVYFIEAVRKYGALSGGLRGMARICRCHPFHPGGEDPP